MSSSRKEITIQDLIEKGEAELKTGPFGTQLKANEYVEEGTPVINVRNIGFGGIREEKLEFLDQDTVERLSSHLLKKDDIVFGRKGAVERHAFINEKFANWFQGSDCLRLRINSSSVLPRFLSYQFLTEHHKQWMMQQCSHGATMASLNQDIVSRIPVTLPPIEEQKQIVENISAFDDLIENNTRRIAILEEIVRLIYREWFVHYRYPGHEKDELVDSGTSPKKWKEVQAQDIIDFNPRTSIDKSKERTYLPMGNVSENSMVIDDADLEKRTGSGGTKFKNKDTLFARITPSLENGKTGFVQFLAENEIALGSTEFIIMRSKKVNPYYVYCLARDDKFRETAIKSMAGASGRQRVRVNSIKEYKIALPPQDILDEFATKVEPMFEQVHMFSKQNKRLKETRDLLLPRLVSGKINL